MQFIDIQKLITNIWKITIKIKNDHILNIGMYIIYNNNNNNNNNNTNNNFYSDERGIWLGNVAKPFSK